MPLRIPLAALLLLASVAQSQERQAIRDPTSQLAWLVGGVWTASGPQLGPHMQRIETRYTWSDNHTFIRFTTHFVTDSAEVHRYDGNLFWNEAQQTLGAWYMNAEHEITEGPVTLTDTGWEMSFRTQDASGKDAPFRVEILKKSNDLYQWSLRENVGGAWKELLVLDYVRKA
jgi:hypothetical protein